MKVVPAIDLMDGKCVRLTQGKREAATVYSDQPGQLARRWQQQGADLIHVVDLDGAFSGFPGNLEGLEEIAKAVEIPVQFGGGLRELAFIREAFNRGAARVILGTSALKNRDLVEQACHANPGQIMLALDAQEGRLAVEGWQEITSVRAVEFVQAFQTYSLAAVVYTDVGADGTLAGPNLEAVEEMVKAAPFPLFVAGGIASLEDIKRLKKIVGLYGVILGKALYAGRVSLREAIALAEQGD